jgi:CcmD family protein
MVWSTFAGTASANEDGPMPVSPAAQAQEQEDADSDPEANLPYLFAVYIITWGGFFAYTFFMSLRQREMRRELDALKAAVAEREAGESPPE